MPADDDRVVIGRVIGRVVGVRLADEAPFAQAAAPGLRELLRQNWRRRHASVAAGTASAHRPAATIVEMVECFAMASAPEVATGAGGGRRMVGDRTLSSFQRRH